MGVLYLVRHGQAPAHAYVPGPVDENAAPLTDLGFTQARATGRALARQVGGFSATISGGLPRQRATLAGVLEAFDGPHEAVADSGWDEYSTPDMAALGAAAGDLHSDPAGYQQRLDAALLDWIDGGERADRTDGPRLGGETYAEYVARISDAAERAVALAGSGQTVLAVSSAGTITALIAQLWGVPAHQWPVLPRTMVNASITKLLVGRSGLTVVSVNEHAHLSATDVGLATFR